MLGIPLLLSGCGGPFSTLDPGGPGAAGIAWLWWGMFGYASVVLVGLVWLWLHAMRRDPGNISDKQAQTLQNRWIFWGGLVLPSVSVSLILAFGLPAGYPMLPTPPEEGEAVRINVEGHQWRFETSYPGTDIVLENHMLIPAGVPIDVYLTSADVIHSFWVPRLSGKQDMVPGHTNVLRIMADEPGRFRGHCAEFCGLDHAHMKLVVEALEPQEFDAWLEESRTDE
ncbi:hypothetical protein LCGC14_0030300 [marine sediment metagenome]